MGGVDIRGVGRGRLLRVSFFSFLVLVFVDGMADFMISTVIWREVPGIRIPGGSEDVMLDLAIRQMLKLYQNKTRKLEKAAGGKL